MNYRDPIERLNSGILRFYANSFRKKGSKKSGHLIDLEDEYGKPLRFYAKTYDNIKLKGEDAKTQELEDKLNRTTYKYKLRRDAFLKLAGDIEAWITLSNVLISIPVL